MIPLIVRQTSEELKNYCFSYIRENEGVVQDRDILVALHSLNYVWNWDESSQTISNVHPGKLEKVKILKIEEGVEETMDLSVPSSHSYVVQGLISHNTANLPTGYTIDQYKDLFRYAHRKGLKGFTSYNPEGSLAPILSAKPEEKKDEVRLDPKSAPKRPKELPCDIHTLTSKGQKYILLIGLLEEKPYEVFLSEYKDEYFFVQEHKDGIIRKVKKGHYQLVVKNGEERLVIDNISQSFNADYEAMSRLLSITLRHGTPVEFVVEQLGKSGHFGTWGKTVSLILKKYIKDGERVKSSIVCPNCGSTNLVYVEGCMTCKDCQSSKCG